MKKVPKGVPGLRGIGKECTNQPKESTVNDSVASLKELPFDEFFERSFEQLLLRSPQILTKLGMTESFGLQNDSLDNLSDAYIRETEELEAAILQLLREYHREELSPEQQLSYDIYEWFLDEQVRGHTFRYYDYPLHFFLASYNDRLVRLFTENHPVTNKQDAEDYITRLSQVYTQVEQLLEGLRLREKAGIIPPKVIIEMTKDWMTKYLHKNSDLASTDGKLLSVYTVFQEKLGKTTLSMEEKQVLRDAALKEIEESFIPAYVKLLEYLEYVETIATDDAGVWKFPKGDEFYAYVLRRETSTNLTGEEIHEIGLKEVNRIQTEMYTIFRELGYPQDETLDELIKRAMEDGGSYDISTQAGRDQYIKAYEAILDEVTQNLDAAFDIRPRAELVVKGDPASMVNFYAPGSLDGSRPCAFHVGLRGTQVPALAMKVVAYHEAIPGHHFQIALARELELPLFRNFARFNGYVEGWALYAEQLAWELGFFDNDPYGNIGRLLLELLRAVRLVADTGIHAKKWTREEARQYMQNVLGDSLGLFAEVDRYIIYPGQATGYKVGMIKILELRQKTMEELGDQFDLKEFHSVVLGSGSIPLGILERIVQDYIDAKLDTNQVPFPAP